MFRHSNQTLSQTLTWERLTPPRHTENRTSAQLLPHWVQSVYVLGKELLQSRSFSTDHVFCQSSTAPRSLKLGLTSRHLVQHLELSTVVVWLFLGHIWWTFAAFFLTHNSTQPSKDARLCPTLMSRIDTLLKKRIGSLTVISTKSYV